MAASRILRNTDPSPYQFAAVGSAGDIAPPTFAPLHSLSGAGGPSAADPEPSRQAEATFEDGRQQGRADRDAEVAELQAEVDRLTADLEESQNATEQHVRIVTEAADRLSDGWTGAVRSMEPDLVALALEAAEAVLDAPLSAEQRSATEAALSGAVGSLAARAPVTISLHPVDLLHLQETGLATALESAHNGLRWEPLSKLAEGDWTVTSAEAAVRRVRTEMLGALRDRLGIDSPDA